MSYPRSIPFAQALALIKDAGGARPTGSERVALRDAAGRVLAMQVIAPMSLPSFDNSAMDGFALRAGDLVGDSPIRLKLVGDQFAGSALPLLVGEGECVRITTGAPLPAGADTVVIKEASREEGEHVWFEPGLARGTNVRRCGEDVLSGDALLAAGTTLTSPMLGLLAALGFAEIAVARRPSVAVFTTGDELRPPGSTLQPGEIFDSNRVLLQSLLADEGLHSLAWPSLPDDAARLHSALDDAAQAYQLVITCGGVSAGEKDLLPALLERHGRIRFWKVLMRPGMPVLFGEWGQALVLGLPGNPVSVLATFRQLARPLLDAMQGRGDRVAALRARLQHPVSKSHSRLEFRRARLSCGADGTLGVRAHPAAGSHQQRGAAESNALMVLEADVTRLDAGELVEVEAYGPILRD